MVLKIIYFTLIIGTFGSLVYCSEDVNVLNYLTNKETADEYILCRNCGSDISSSDSLIFKTSPASLHTFNDTLFNRDKVLVQVLPSDIFFHFPVFTTAESTCAGLGEWEEEDSWFPGYRWKSCVCPDCGAYVGLVFEPINLVQSSKSYRFTGQVSRTRAFTLTMAAVDNLSPEDQEFLAKCEEELKNRYTENDEEFMKVFNAEPLKPPIIESWWVPNNSGRRNDRRTDRRNHPYERHGNRDRNYQDRRDNYGRRGYNDYDDRGQGYGNQRPRRY